MKKGNNLIRLLQGIRNKILQNWIDFFNFWLQPENEKTELAVETPVIVNFKGYPFRFLKHQEGFIQFEAIHFNFLQNVVQTKFDFDRSESSDFILIVENYFTQQRNFVSKTKEVNKIILSEPIV